MKAIKKFIVALNGINNVFAGAAAVILVAITLAISVDAVRRYVTGISFGGLFEITEFSLLWITFLATSWLLRKDGHVNLDLVIANLKPRVKIFINIVTSAINAAVFAFIGWYGVIVTLQDLETKARLGTVMRPLKWPIEIIIPIGCLLLFLQLLAKILVHTENLRALPDEDQKA